MLFNLDIPSNKDISNYWNCDDIYDCCDISNLDKKKIINDSISELKSSKIVIKKKNIADTSKIISNNIFYFTSKTNKTNNNKKN